MAEQRSDHIVAGGLSLAGLKQPRVETFSSATEHLRAELKRLDLLLRQQVLQLRAARLITEDEFRGLYIPDAQVDALLAQESDTDATREDDALPDAPELAPLAEQTKKEIEARVQASLMAGVDLPLPRLAALFHLTPFEVDVLLVCLAPELDLRYETLYAYVQNDVTKKRPRVDLALKLLCSTPEQHLASRSTFTAEAALLRHHLVRLFDDPQEREPPLLSRLMKLDQRVVDFLLGNDHMDSRLLAFTERVTPARSLSELVLPGALTERLAHAGRSCDEGGNVIFFFHGPYGVGKQSTAEAICAAQKLPLLIADLRRAGALEQGFATSIALLRREATLQGAALYLSHFEALLSDEERLSKQPLELARELAEPTCPIFIGSETPWHPAGLWKGVRFLSLEFPMPEFPLRQQLWQRALEGKSERLGPDVDLGAVANKFVLSGGQIEDAVGEVEHLLALRPAEESDITLADLHAAARDQSNQGLRRLAQKVEAMYRWTDIVLPSRPMQQLREVCVSVKYRHVVHSHWGFSEKLSLGKGLNVLFSGSSGTGKTMAAQILARELSLDLYKIDLSSVVSKYIGETEKNLSRIFRDAQASNAILFFDEADALFGKRSEVKDAHDRYANIEVAYLLQKMEEYEGIVILATNLSGNLDDAFARRMHHVVEFPMPDAIYRERIWRGMFPPQAPLDAGVDFVFLARQFDLSGGNIRNVALAAAFMAAEENCSIRMDHLIRGTARELQKIGKMPSKADFLEYYELIREHG